MQSPVSTSKRIPIALALLFTLTTASCISHQSDNVDVGTLCIGRPQCHTTANIQREGVGRTRIDFSIKNEGATTADVTIEITVPDENPSIPPHPVEILGVRHYTLAPKETNGDRFTSLENGTRRALNLVLTCATCYVSMNYVVGIEPIECRKSSKCDSAWTCDESRGICVECVKNSDCKPEQLCAQNGRCTPADRGSSCSIVATNTDIPVTPLLVFLGFITAQFILRRRVTL